jgi:hypothetical protein
MLTVLSSCDCEDVIEALETKPTLWSPVDLYNWVLHLITTLFHYIKFFMGNNADLIQKLQFQIQELKEKSQSILTQTTLPTPTLKQHAYLTCSFRCQCCHTIGHGTNDCCTKDPVAVKKRVSNNQKTRKRAAEQSQLPPIHSPYYGPTVFLANPYSFIIHLHCLKFLWHQLQMWKSWRGRRCNLCRISAVQVLPPPRPNNPAMFGSRGHVGIFNPIMSVSHSY